MFNPFKRNNQPSQPSSSTFAEFVGFFTAHAVWQTEGGGNVIPVLAYKDQGQPALERVSAEEYSAAAEQATRRYEELRQAHAFTLMALDGYITLPGSERTEAITVTASDRGTGASVTVAVPYQSEPQAAIYRPKVLEHAGVDPETFFEAFWKGVDSHKEAAAYWNAHMDQSK